MGKLFNLARMTTATTGAGTITLGSAVSGYLTFALAGVSNLDIVSYAIKDGANSEIGIGTYTASGTTLSRTVTKSTNSNTAISLSGTAEVFITPRAEDLLNLVTPQGRLTLTSGTAVPTSDVSAATTVYYTPATGVLGPIWDGTSFGNVNVGGELSQATADATKSPAAVAASQVYDKFLWSDAGTIRCTRGPTWASGTAGSNTVRGTGSGSTELIAVNGILVNKNAITNGPAAGFGTYVGTICSNASSSIDLKFGSSAAGGGAAVVNVWNAYNQVPVTAIARDSTANWSYQSGSPRFANTPVGGGVGNRVTFVCGLAVCPVDAMYTCMVNYTAGASSAAAVSFGLEGASIDWQDRRVSVSAAIVAQLTAIGSYKPLLGSHFIQAFETTDASNNNQFVAGGASQALIYRSFF